MMAAHFWARDHNGKYKADNSANKNEYLCEMRLDNAAVPTPATTPATTLDTTVATTVATTVDTTPATTLSTSEGESPSVTGEKKTTLAWGRGCALGPARQTEWRKKGWKEGGRERD